MQTVVLVAGEHHAASAAQLYEAFGSGSGSAGPGWLLDARCDAVRPGAAVSAQLPLGAAGSQVLLLGRISHCSRGARITIVHDQPWRGRIVLRFTDEPGGSSLRVTAELDDEGLHWWMEQRGWRDEPRPRDDVHRIGLLTSKTGPGAVFALSCEHLAHLAVARINAEGGIGGRPVDLEIHDDATDAGRAALEARRMVDGGARAILASVTSASFNAVAAAVADTGLPVIHPVLNEGGPARRNVFRWGERPSQQLAAALPLMRREGADRRWYHVGNDYSWSRGAHQAALRAIGAVGGTVVRHRLVPLGTRDFDQVVDEVAASGAGSVLSSLVGADEVAFQRAFFESGHRVDRTVLSLVMEGSTRELIGHSVADGIWSAFGYFGELTSDDNIALHRTYEAEFGTWAPPISAISEAVYEALVLYADAARTASDDRDQIVRRLRGVSAQLPRGHVSLEGFDAMRQRMHVARSAASGYVIVEP